VETKYLPSTPDFWQSAVGMFLRSNNRKKDGKDHRYFSIVENHRLASDKTVQRTVLYSIWVRSTTSAVGVAQDAIRI
jgi:hypothetical protein